MNYKYSYFIKYKITTKNMVIFNPICHSVRLNVYKRVCVAHSVCVVKMRLFRIAIPSFREFAEKVQRHSRYN